MPVLNDYSYSCIANNLLNTSGDTKHIWVADINFVHFPTDL